MTDHSNFSDHIVADEAKLKKALRESEQRYRGLLENLHAGVVIHAPDTSILMNNLRAAELLGLADEQMRGKLSIDPAWHFVLEDNRICPLEMYPVHRIKNTLKPIYNQIIGASRLTTNDTVWLQVNGSPSFDSEGNLKEIAISFIDITEQRNAETELKVKESKYRTLMEQAVDGIFIANANQKYVEVNAKACQMLGYSREELLEQHVQDLILPEDLQENQLHYTEILKGNPVLSERRLLRKDGTTIFTEINGKILEDGRIQAIVRDITDRKKMEQTLIISEANMRAVLDNSDEAILFIDKERKIQFFNQLAYEQAKLIFNFKIGIGISILDLLSEKDFKIFEDNYNLAFSGQQCFFEQSFYVDKDMHWFKLQYAPIKNNLGEVIGVIFKAEEITKRKKIENESRHSEIKFSTIFERVPVGIALLESSSGRFIQINPKYCEILNLSMDEIRSLSFLDITHPDDLFEYLDKLHLLIDGKTQLVTMENRYIRKDGSIIWVNLIYVPLELDGNENKYHIAIVSDITEAKKNYARLIEYTESLKSLNATKDKFFNIIAHDLRNPFAGIIGLSEMMESKLLEDENHRIEEIANFARLINASSKSAYSLLENLMHWAKAQTGEISYRPQSISVNDIVDSTLQVLIGSAFKKQIVIEKDLEDGIHVFADQSLFSTILRNLIGNAIKFSYFNGRIKLSATRLDDFLEISISDTGTGIKADNLDKLFRIDSKFTKMGTDNEKGTGLGLILCKEFIGKQHGKIHVKSELGKGSTFSFTLPLAK
ncbi:MAG TPA: PAS domain S-box protein [Leptospiraceae bacterium]|nr:PAS domain S-box protein [Leptospiraceae bacterium]HRG74061.1 PAS domain S-box protein [Leptospiraceae bacterium]